MSAECHRRAVLAGTTATAVAMGLSSCMSDGPRGGWTVPADAVDARRGRLAFRPPPRPSATAGVTGRFELRGAPETQPAAVYVPPGHDGGPLRLVVMLHGAGGIPGSALKLLRDEAERRRLILLAPKSSATTWDVISSGYGPDVENLDRLLARLAATYAVRAYTIGGFSDGASYALSLGIANGDVFDSVIAFSPGFEAAGVENGRPRFFVSHGTQDRVLPIDRCSRRIVRALRKAGYDVRYKEFEGGHTVPAAVRVAALDWLDHQSP